jgi:hypothetical protein
LAHGTLLTEPEDADDSDADTALTLATGEQSSDVEHVMAD